MAGDKSNLSLQVTRFSLLYLTGSLFVVLQTLFVGRLLKPEDLGLITTLGLLITFSRITANLGLLPAIVVFKDESKRDHRDYLFTIIIITAFIVAAMLLLTPYIGGFFETGDSKSIVQAGAFCVCLASLATFMESTLERDLQFSCVGTVEFISNLISVGLGITLILNNYGAWSLIYGLLAFWISRTLAYTYFMARKNYSLLPSFRFVSDKKVWRYALFTAGQRTLNFLSSNVDYILIGYFLGAKALGIYVFAYEMTMFITNKFILITTRVCTPILTEKSNQSDFPNTFIHLHKLNTTVTVPISIIVILVLPDILKFIINQSWNESLSLLYILAIAAVARAIGSTVGPLIASKKAANISLYWSGFATTLSAIMIYIGVQYNILTVSILFSLTQLGLLLIAAKVLISPLAAISTKDYYSATIPAAFYSVIIITTFFLLNRLMANFSATISMSVTLLIYGLITTYILFSTWKTLPRGKNDNRTSVLNENPNS